MPDIIMFFLFLVTLFILVFVTLGYIVYPEEYKKFIKKTISKIKDFFKYIWNKVTKK